MFHKFEGWAKAPEGTTHFCTQDCGSPWLKVDAVGFLWYHNDGRWQPYYTKAAGHRHMMRAIVRPKKRAKAKAVAAYKPLNVGEELTIENLRATQAYGQIKRFVANNKATPYQQGQLVKLFLEEYNNCQKGEEAADWCDQFNEDQSIIRAFNWEKSKHGFNFWSAVHNGRQVVNLAAVLGGKPAAKQEDKLMNMGKLKKTPAYKSIVAFVKLNHKGIFFDETIKAVCNRFIYEYNKRHPDGRDKPLEAINIMNAFAWPETREGSDYWRSVHRCLPYDEVLPLVKPDKPDEAKVVEAHPRVDGGVEVAFGWVKPADIPPAPKPVEAVKQEEPKPKVGKVGWW